MRKSHATKSVAVEAYERLDKLLQVSGAPHRFYDATSCIMLIKDEAPDGTLQQSQLVLQMSVKQWEYYAVILRELGGTVAITSAISNSSQGQEFLQYRIWAALEEPE